MELTWFVGLYLLVSVVIGLITAKWVHTSKDFAVAGRHLPLPVVTATVFATWFGSEAIFGASSTFAKKGLGGIVADPFGAACCLIIAGVFFSSKLYKLNVLTLGDYFRSRYGRAVEILTTLCIIIAYLGWVSAQIKALGLVFSLLSHGSISQTEGMILGAAVVLTYTAVGGMFSVAVLDFIQMTVIIGGLIYIAWLVSGMTGGAEVVIAHAAAAGKLEFFPNNAGLKEWLVFIAPFVTMMLGSIPQQDVFQRITSANSAKTALRGSLFGGSFYLLFCFVPIFIAYAATLVQPEFFNALLESDPEQIIPELVLRHMPLFAQVLFFGAVISAIMSTSSATLLAPSVSFAENIVRGFLPQLSDRGFLRVMRICTVCFTGLVLCFALMNQNTSIYQMVESAYSVTLAGAFVPLIIGPFWRRASNQGALAAILLGISAWLIAEYGYGEADIGALIGLGFSCIGMVAGSLLPQWIKSPEHGMGEGVAT
ncbi:MAG: sodium:solute symporter family protein [Zoogloeaceae bacterium]|jgi:SSS family transporter|nr:sodium:solute symporter family protein [Zoogloeaceae bacterium]